MKYQVVNANIITTKGIIKNGCCAFENGIISYVGNKEQNITNTFNAQEQYLLPGFVDIHCHGGNGFEFIDSGAKEMQHIALYHLKHGTTTMIATTTADTYDNIEKCLINYKNHKKLYPDSTLNGVHLEGPWINPKQSGAQNPDIMCKPDIDKLKEWKNKYPFINRISAAPELDNGYDLGKAGKQLDIVMSIAHSDANFSEVEKALDNGYSLMTHLYSGMNGVTRKNSFRSAGAVEAGLYFNDLYVELIADLKHLPIELLKFVYKIKGKNKICLVTDAIRASGMTNGTKTTIGSKTNGLDVIVEDDVAKLLDRQSFAGSTATYDRLFKNVMNNIDIDLVEAMYMSSFTPSKIMNLNDRGEIAIGKKADLLLLDKNYDIKTIFYNGIKQEI